MRAINEEKKKLVYDATILRNMYSTSNSDRTGVYFTVYNVFLQLMKQERYQVLVYAEEWAKAAVARAVRDCGFADVPVFGDEELKEEKFDIFLTLFAPPPDYVAQSPVAKYMLLNDVTPLVLPDIEAPDKVWFQRLEHSLNGNDYYFAISEYTKKDFLRFFPALNPDRVKVVYPATSAFFYHCIDKKRIDNVKRKYSIPIDDSYIFCPCTIQPRKNLIHAVKCFIKFVEENKIEDLNLVLGGDDYDELIKIIEDEVGPLGDILPRIIHAGSINDCDLSMLYSGAMFTVYVSLYEGFGLPVLEAMKCGCPVITSNVTSMPEVIGDTGITVDPRDPVALRKAYKRMYSDVAFRESCSRNGLKRAETFSWEKFADTVISVITETCEDAIAENRARMKEESKTKRKEKGGNKKIHWFGRVLTENRTTFYFLGLPVARKDRLPDRHITRLFGIPFIKSVFNYYVITTYFGPIAIKRRLNFPYIESQVDLYTGSFAHSMLLLRQKIESNTSQHSQIIETQALFHEKIQSVRMYQLIRAMEDGTMTLESELRKINTLIDQEGDKSNE